MLLLVFLSAVSSIASFPMVSHETASPSKAPHLENGSREYGDLWVVISRYCMYHMMRSSTAMNVRNWISSVLLHSFFTTRRASGVGLRRFSARKAAEVQTNFCSCLLKSYLSMFLVSLSGVFGEGITERLNRIKTTHTPNYSVPKNYCDA